MTTILNKEKILEQARIFADEGKYDKAIGEYEKILIADPTDLRVKLRVAELHTKRKQVAEAIRIYREVADAYSGEGFYLKAVTVLKNILRLNPTLVDVNQMLAELYERMGLTQDAIRQYSILATTLDQKGEGDKALEVRKKIVDLDPDAVDARIKLAESYQKEGKAEEAVDQYEALARIYEARGKKDLKLADMYEKILSHRENLEMLKALCKIYDEAGERKKALKWIEQSKNIASDDPDLLGMQAHIYASLNQIETARSKFLSLAELLKNDGRIEDAVAAYAEILMLIPGEDEKIYKRAEDLREGAADELKKVVEKRRKDMQEQERKKDEERIRTEEETKKKEDVAKKQTEQKRAVSKRPEAPQVKPAKEPVKPPQPVVPAEMKIKDADSAFDLGGAYWKMGLTDEARVEFEKARKVYEEQALGGGKDANKYRQRLNTIEMILKGKGQQAPQAAPAPEKNEWKPVEKKVEPVLKTKEPSEKKGKKISFV